jgi:hypothetical protein
VSDKPTIEKMTGDPRLVAVMAELESVCSDGNSDVRRVALAVLRVADAQDAGPAVARVQAWLADERQAGRLIMALDDAWIRQFLNVARGGEPL